MRHLLDGRLELSINATTKTLCWLPALDRLFQRLYEDGASGAIS